METIFRLLLKRPAVAQAEETPSIPLAQNSNLQADMGQAMLAPDVRAALKAAASKFIATAGFAGDPKAIAQYPQFKQLKSELDELEKKSKVTHADVAKAINNAFGDTPANLVKKKTLNALAANFRDSIVAIKQLPEQHKRPVEELTNMLRDIEMVLKTNADANFPGSGAVLQRFRRRSLLLPTEVDLRSILSTREKDDAKKKERDQAEKDRQKKAGDGFNLYKRLKAAIEELTNLGGEHLNSTPQKPSTGFLPATELRPLAVFAQEMGQQKLLSQLSMVRAQALIGRNTVGEKGAELVGMDAGQGIAQAAGTTTVQRRFFAGTAAFQPMLASAIGFRLKGTALDSLSQSTRELLKERGLSITENPLDQIVAKLKVEMTVLGHELEALMGTAEKVSFKRVGSTLVKIKTLLPSGWNQVLMGSMFPLSPLVPIPVADNRVPHTHGSIAPVGVADLLVVKQQLIRYEAMDIGHIENVLQGEAKIRDHRNLRQTEETTFNETETTKTEERDLESTDRFEMKRESEQTIKEDASLKAGLSVSGSYGPTVEFAVSAEGSLSRSKTEATKSATTFSKDVTQRTSNKLTERVLQRSSLRVTNEVEEKNNHTLTNVPGTGHIRGIYQWVEKVYEAQMFNYGLRQMYDFMVPEPGAYLIQAMGSAHASMLEIEKPTNFTLRPDQITESNYHYWVHQYGATDVNPPPEEYKTKAANYSAGGGDEKTNYNQSGQIQIEEGYKAIHATIAQGINNWEGEFSIDYAIGSRVHRYGNDNQGDWVFSTTLDGERDSIPYGINSRRVADLAVVIEVKCQRTERAMEKWRLETHGKLVNAYNAKLADYEERLTAMEMQAGVAIKGKNPGLNLELMKDELKKQCTTIITAQHYDLFDAIQNGGYGTEQIDMYENESEGPYVRFFEQAFEWEHVTWVTYPYFWGRKSKWAERVAYEDVDPLFNQFLKAGYCRVSVPVRPGFEGAVDHFITFGEIWNGGPLPAISNPLYLPIADEIAERLQRPGDEFPEGDPWEVRVPTSLIYLKKTGDLPVWQKNAQGNWVPVP
ncbi:MAG: hypothetical protein AAB433_22590 [Nitrospirota bacterium]